MKTRDEAIAALREAALEAELESRRAVLSVFRKGLEKCASDGTEEGLLEFLNAKHPFEHFFLRSVIAEKAREAIEEELHYGSWSDELKAEVEPVFQSLLHSIATNALELRSIKRIEKMHV